MLKIISQITVYAAVLAFNLLPVNSANACNGPGRSYGGYSSWRPQYSTSRYSGTVRYRHAPRDSYRPKPQPPAKIWQQPVGVAHFERS